MVGGTGGPRTCLRVPGSDVIQGRVAVSLPDPDCGTRATATPRPMTAVVRGSLVPTAANNTKRGHHARLTSAAGSRASSEPGLLPTSPTSLLYTTFSPSVLTIFGLSWRALAAANPSIVQWAGCPPGARTAPWAGNRTMASRQTMGEIRAWLGSPGDDGPGSSPLAGRCDPPCRSTPLLRDALGAPGATAPYGGHGVATLVEVTMIEAGTQRRRPKGRRVTPRSAEPPRTHGKRWSPRLPARHKNRIPCARRD